MSIKKIVNNHNILELVKLAPNIQDWINELGLTKHPEGGYFKEVYRSPLTVSGQKLPGQLQLTGLRNLATSIYFLLPSTEVSHFHRLKSDEIWYFHTGSSLTVYMIEPKGALLKFKLGLNSTQEEIPQLLIPAGTIFGALVNQEESYSFSLVSCLVAPGFDFQDFELFSRIEMLTKYPQHEKIILKLT